MEFISTILDNKIYYVIFQIIIMLITLKVIDIIFKRLVSKSKIHFSFLKSLLQALVVIVFIFQIGSMSDIFSKFYNTILMSSSLLVVVLGFVFQEGLSNIVHGFILIFFKPFDIGDRVRIIVDEQTISGYVLTINLRNTIIQNVVNNSHVIIPNAKMDLCVIDNSHFNEATTASYLLDVGITYESDLELAIEMYGKIIARHPLVYTARKPEERDLPVKVLVSNLAESSITLRASVVTNTIEENFQACSDIRREVVLQFGKEPKVNIAYPHVVVVKE